MELGLGNDLGHDSLRELLPNIVAVRMSLEAGYPSRADEKSYLDPRFSWDRNHHALVAARQRKAFVALRGPQAVPEWDNEMQRAPHSQQSNRERDFGLRRAPTFVDPGREASSPIGR